MRAENDNKSSRLSVLVENLRQNIRRSQTLWCKSQTCHWLVLNHLQTGAYRTLSHSNPSPTHNSTKLRCSILFFSSYVALHSTCTLVNTSDIELLDSIASSTISIRVLIKRLPQSDPLWDRTILSSCFGKLNLGTEGFMGWHRCRMVLTKCWRSNFVNVLDLV